MCTSKFLMSLPCYRSDGEHGCFLLKKFRVFVCFTILTVCHVTGSNEGSQREQVD